MEGQGRQGQPPTVPWLSLPSAFLLSPFLSGVKLPPLTSHAEQFSQFVVLTALAPANFLPSGAHRLAQAAYQSIL